MKNVLFASAALAAVAFAAPAFAQDASGFVGGSYTYTDAEGLESDTWGLDGAVAFAPAESLGVQFDAGYARTEVESFDAEDAYNANIHLFTRNDSWAFGGFAGLTEADDTTAWNLGVEGATYLDNLTLAGALAYGSSDDLGVDAWGVGGEARYFVTDNFRLNAGLGWADAEDDSVLSLGLGGEYQLSSTPFSVHYAYNHFKFDQADIETDQFTIGMRVSFGGQSLKGRDRSGASFTGASAVFGGLL